MGTLSEMIPYTLVVLIFYAGMKVTPTDGQLYRIEMDDGIYIAELENMSHEEVESITNELSTNDDESIGLGSSRDNKELSNSVKDEERNSEATKFHRWRH